MIGAWCLWKKRNEVSFDRKVPCLVAWITLLELTQTSAPQSRFVFKPCNFYLFFFHSFSLFFAFA
jgi:hypothetical protein